MAEFLRWKQTHDRTTDKFEEFSNFIYFHSIEVSGLHPLLRKYIHLSLRYHRVAHSRGIDSNLNWKLNSNPRVYLTVLEFIEDEHWKWTTIVKIGGLFEVALPQPGASSRDYTNYRRWQIAWQIGLCSQTTSSSYERDWYRERCPSARGWTKGMEIVKSTRVFPHLRPKWRKKDWRRHGSPSIKRARIIFVGGTQSFEELFPLLCDKTN